MHDNLNLGDNIIWNPSPTGFSIKSTWELIRHSSCSHFSFTNIWNSRIQTKISTFMWKLLNQGIPLDEYLKKLCICIPSMCRCYSIHKEETWEHLFFNSTLAKNIWDHFQSLIGLSFQASTFKGNLMLWWFQARGKSIRSLLCKIIPSLICWHIWKARNAKKN